MAETRNIAVARVANKLIAVGAASTVLSLVTISIGLTLYRALPRSRTGPLVLSALPAIAGAMSKIARHG